MISASHDGTAGDALGFVRTGMSFHKQKWKLKRESPVGAGKTCIVVDDIADTADTLCQAADKLKATC